MADTDRPKRMFAVVRDGLYIGAVHQWASVARLEVGEEWANFCGKGSARDGWKTAKKRGYRIVPVIVTPADK